MLHILPGKALGEILGSVLGRYFISMNICFSEN